MRKIGAWLAPGMAALALLSAPLSAQEAESGTTEVLAGDDERPLAGMSPEQVAAFFTLVATSPDLDSQLALMVEEMLEPGDPVPGWRETGVDILAELAAREGGLSANLLRDEDTEVLSVSDLSGKAAPDVAGFSRLVLRASSPGGVDERTFVSFAPGVWLEMTTQRTMRGNAMCYSGLYGMILHSKVPATEQSIDELLPTIVAVNMIDRFAAREFCLVYQRDGDGFRTRSFLPDGRSLPKLDANSTLLRVMPAPDLSAFIRETVPVAPAE